MIAPAECPMRWISGLSLQLRSPIAAFSSLAAVINPPPGLLAPSARNFMFSQIALIPASRANTSNARSLTSLILLLNQLRSAAAGTPIFSSAVLRMSAANSSKPDCQTTKIGLIRFASNQGPSNARPVDAIRPAVQSAMIVNGHVGKSVTCRRGDAVAHHQANGIVSRTGRYMLALGCAVMADKNDVPGFLAVDPWRHRAEVAGDLGTQHRPGAPAARRAMFPHASADCETSAELAPWPGSCP